LRPRENDPIRHINLPALTTNAFSDIKIKVETLSLLIDSPDPNLLMGILLEQERFEMALKAIEVRSRRHEIDFQSKLATQVIPEGARVTASKYATLQT
jgi:hypothetical protein